MSKIALNFLPLTTEQFTIPVHCRPYSKDHRPEINGEKAMRRSLVMNGRRAYYWTLFKPMSDSTPYTCHHDDDIDITLDALRVGLSDSCKKQLGADQYSVLPVFRRPIEITIKRYDEGARVVRLYSYFLHSKEQFGFLADLRFHPEPEFRGTVRALKRSLSLDKRGNSNVNYYADRYAELTAFIAKYHSVLFPLTLPGGDQVTVSDRLSVVASNSLEAKTYIVGSARKTKSQFMGIRHWGPLQDHEGDAYLYFVYRQQDLRLSRDLYMALRGDTFNTFPGMKDMFNVPISPSNVRGMEISEFSYAAIEDMRDILCGHADDRTVVPIILTPFSRHDKREANETYWKLKHAFLEKRLSSQIVSCETVADRNTLKWATSGIGLQVFAKLGGIPWKVLPRSEKCLIIGIGQAHQRRNSVTERYFAYSVLTDSSGIFSKVRVLGDEKTEESYLNGFRKELSKIVDEYSGKYGSFVVHTTFTIRRSELNIIKDILNAAREQSTGDEFVAMKFNDRNRYFGYAAQHNSRVPFESTIVSLSDSEYIVWFEGLQYGKMALHKKTASPLHVKFTFPRRLTITQKKRYLQDAINLSGANWRGFNAKAAPVSIYYAKLIAEYLKEFDNVGLERVDVNIIKPWFL